MIPTIVWGGILFTT